MIIKGKEFRMIAYILFAVLVIVSIVMGVKFPIVDAKFSYDKGKMVTTEEFNTGIMFLGVVLSFIPSVFIWILGWIKDEMEYTNWMLKKMMNRENSTDQLVHSTKVPTANKSTVNKNNSEQATLSKDFIEEITNADTADLKLILEDQQDLYTSDEITFIKSELSNR